MKGVIVGIRSAFDDTWKAIPESVKHTGDGTSMMIILGSFTELLPHIAAIVSILWGLIRIYETKTVQNMLPCNRKTRGK